MNSEKDTLRPEYPADLIKSGVRGKYVKRYREGINIQKDGDKAEGEPYRVKQVRNVMVKYHLAGERWCFSMKP